MRVDTAFTVLAALLAAQGSLAQANQHNSKYTPTSYTSKTSSSTAKLENGVSFVKPMYSFPNYPTVDDYASGTCVGYAFCFATWNPPVVTEPDVMCPAGYDLSNSNGAAICVQKSGVCPNGFDLSSTGDCCTVRATGQCYANWDSCSGGVASAGSFMYSGDVCVGSICKGSSEYKAVVDNVQLVQVTTGSKWFDGSMNGMSDDYSDSDSSSSSDDGDGDGTVQVIPSGNMVNLNGQFVRVGPIPAGVPLSDGSSMSGSSSSGSGYTVVTGGSTQQQQQQQQQPSGLTPAQQAALNALQQQALTQGTYIADQDDNGSSSSGGTSIPPATLANQQAALAALQQQAQQQGTYIADQSGDANSTGSNLGPQYGLPTLTQPVMPGTTSASARYAGAATAGGKVAPPKEGLALMSVLFMLPKIILPSAVGAAAKLPLMAKMAAAKPTSFSITVPSLPRVIPNELVATKQVMASAMNKKEDFLPKCFSKCCTPDADVVCTPASQTINYAKPAYLCPSGCTFIDNTNKCLCSSGHFTPCQPTDTVCSWGDQPICVGSSSFFGIEACKFVGALQQHLPKVQCPYKSLSKGLDYSLLG